MNATETVISRDWMLWISENLLRGCTPTSMLQTMTAAGLDPVATRQALLVPDARQLQVQVRVVGQDRASASSATCADHPVVGADAGGSAEARSVANG